MHLRQRIELYLRRTAMKPSSFGRNVVGDPRFVFDLRNGREPREKTRELVTNWLDQHEE